MPTHPKIALVHDFLIRLGGAERVLKVLADAFPQAPIYTLLYDPKKTGAVFPQRDEKFPQGRIRTSYLQKFPHFIRKRHKLLFPLMPRAIEQLNLDEFDIVISSSSAYAHGVVTPTKTLHINYCHSPMRYAWDWYHRYKQEQKVSAFTRAGISYFMKKIREWDRLAADRPDIMLANSENVRRRIRKYYRRDATVVYPPVDIERFAHSTKSEDFFLIVSTLTPYKQIDLAIQLFNKINKKLIIIGDGSDRRRLETLAGPNIDFLGFKSDEVVTEYYKNCRALIFPGEEDFGIAPIEAMACGKPVLALARGGLLETVQPGFSGELFAESTIASMEDGLARLINNQKNYKPLAIRKSVEKFSSEEFIKNIKQIIKDGKIASGFITK